jgi:hypothetical protein
MEKIVPSLAHRFFITIFFTPLNYNVPEKEKAIEKEAARFIVSAAGKRIQCYSWGKGPVVLVVHGWAGRATQFRKIIDGLVRNGFRVVGFDGPAHGHSEGTSTNIFEFEETLKAVHSEVGVPEGIIAHSFGGGAVLLAAMNGLPVRKLVNIASPTIGDDIIDTYLKTINGSAATGKSFKSYIQKKFGKPFDEFTILHFIKHIIQPPDLLLIHDDCDKEVRIRHAVELTKVYPQATLFKTHGLGHTRLLKDDAVIRRCVTFMKSGRRASDTDERQMRG